MIGIDSSSWLAENTALKFLHLLALVEDVQEFYVLLLLVFNCWSAWHHYVQKHIQDTHHDHEFNQVGC